MTLSQVLFILGILPLFITLTNSSIRVAKAGPVNFFPFNFLGKASLNILSLSFLNSILNSGFKLLYGIVFNLFKSFSLSTGLTKVTQSLSGKNLIIFSLITLFSFVPFPQRLFLRHNSKYSLLEISSPVSGCTFSKVKSLMIQINFGDNSVNNSSLLILVFVVIAFDKCAARDNSFIPFSSILE